MTSNHKNTSKNMARSPYQSRRLKFVPVLALLAIAGGYIIYLGFADIPAPTARVEQEIPRDKLLQAGS